MADAGHQLIRKVTPSGFVTTIAGTVGVTGINNGPAAGALFNDPGGMVLDSSGNLFVADMANDLIREVSASGVVSTLAGSGSAGTADGIGSAASFFYPYGVALDTVGNLFVSDRLNHRIRRVTQAGVVTTVAGPLGDPSIWGFAEGTGSSARFHEPYGLVVDHAFNISVGDVLNQRLRRLTPNC